MNSLWQPGFVHADPAINVVTLPDRPHDFWAAEGHRQPHYQAWDMIAGLAWPQLGGSSDLLDIVGVNYYSNNQWIHGGPPIDRFHHQHRPLHQLLIEIWCRWKGNQRRVYQPLVDCFCQNKLRQGLLERYGDVPKPAPHPPRRPSSCTELTTDGAMIASIRRPA